MKITIHSEKFYFKANSQLLQKNGEIEVIEPDFDHPSAQLKRQFYKLPEQLQKFKKNSKSISSKIYLDKKNNKRLTIELV